MGITDSYAHKQPLRDRLRAGYGGARHTHYVAMVIVAGLGRPRAQPYRSSQPASVGRYWSVWSGLVCIRRSLVLYFTYGTVLYGVRRTEYCTASGLRYLILTYTVPYGLLYLTALRPYGLIYTV